MYHNDLPDRALQCLVFVTGNVNKLREVKAILSSGPHPIAMESQSLDGK